MGAVIAVRFLQCIVYMYVCATNHSSVAFFPSLNLIMSRFVAIVVLRH